MIYILYSNSVCLDWNNRWMRISIWQDFACNDCVWIVPGTDIES